MFELRKSLIKKFEAEKKNLEKMSDPNNKAKEYFSKLKEGLKNYEYKENASKFKENLSGHFKNIKNYSENLHSQLKKEKDSINKTQNNHKTNAENINKGSLFTNIYSKSRIISSNISNSIKEGKMKDDLQDLAKTLKNYEYSKKMKELSEKTQQKVNQANIPEKIKVIKEKINETAENYKIKEKLADYSEKGKDSAKSFAEKTKETAKNLGDKTKENLVKTKSFAENKFWFFGNKFRRFGKEKARSIMFFSLLFVFAYGFSTSLPSAYYNYKRYCDEKEERMREREFLEKSLKIKENNGENKK